MTITAKNILYFLGVVFNLVIKVLFALGVALLILNVSGLVIPLRNPAIYNFQDGKDITLTYREALNQIDRLPGESDEDYIHRLTHVLNQAISQYWFEEGKDTYHLRIPPWENYILWFYSYRIPKTYQMYEFTDYRRALERGVGLCSQQAIVETEILERNGIDAKMIGITGHVVASANVDGKWYIVDPDYGIVIPYSIEEIEKTPSIAVEYYKDTWAASIIPPYYASAQDNKQFDSVQAYSTLTVYQLERWAYSAIWYIPLILMTPFILAKILQVFILKRNLRRSIDYEQQGVAILDEVEVFEPVQKL